MANINTTFVGQKFGKLTIIEGFNPNTRRNSKNKFKKYKCLCDCKTEITILTSQLVRGVKSCGCLRIDLNITNKLYEGFKINRFTVIKFCTENNKWELLCSCGKTYFSDAKRILSENTKSCGCLNIDRGKEQAIKLINKRSDPIPTNVLAKSIFSNRYNDGDMNFEDFLFLSQQNCFYCICSAKTSNKMIKKPSKYSDLSKLSEEELTFRYNGLDRVDSSLPHNLSNCVSSCFICNHAKSDMKQEKFINYLKRLANNKIILSFDEYRKLSNNIKLDIFRDEKYFSILKSIRYAMKARYNDNDLTIEKFYQLTQLSCFYCGSEPGNLTNRAKNIKKSSQFAKDTGDFKYNGLDRIDPSLPHLYDNIIPCCKICNFAKNKLSYNEFISWIDRLKLIYKEK